jgi:hypothetical protein
MRFKTTVSKFENGEWTIIEGSVYRNWSKQPTEKMISNAIASILKDLQTIIPGFREYGVEKII